MPPSPLNPCCKLLTDASGPACTPPLATSTMMAAGELLVKQCESSPAAQYLPRPLPLAPATGTPAGGVICLCSVATAASRRVIRAAVGAMTDSSKWASRLSTVPRMSFRRARISWRSTVSRADPLSAGTGAAADGAALLLGTPVAAAGPAEGPPAGGRVLTAAVVAAGRGATGGRGAARVAAGTDTGAADGGTDAAAGAACRATGAAVCAVAAAAAMALVTV